MTSLFLDLPDDVLAEILCNLPTLSILSCRKVCQKLNRLSKVRHVWMTVFYRTQHMLPRTMNPIQDPLPELELAMGRAEKMDHLWSNEEVLGTTRPRSNCLQNQEQRNALTVMGDFIVYNLWCKRGYQWVSRQDPTGKNVVFECTIGDVLVESLHYIDHATGTFFIISRLGTAQQPPQIVEIKLDALDGRPRVESRSQIMLNDGHEVKYMALSNHFVYFAINAPGFDDQLCLDILDLHTKSLSEVRLSNPFSGSRYPLTIHISDTHILFVLDYEKFAIFRRTDPKDGRDQVNPSREYPLQLQVAFSGTYPSPFHNGGYLLPISSPIIFGAPGYEFESGSKIHLMSLGDFGVEGSLKDESIEIIGSTRGFAFFMPSSTQTCYTLGMVSTTKFNGSNRDGTMKIEGNYIYAVRLDYSDQNQDSTANHLNAIKLDLSTWLDDADKYTHLIDFNPFSGTALLCGPPHQIHGPSPQSIIVLDYLSTG